MVAFEDSLRYVLVAQGRPVLGLPWIAMHSARSSETAATSSAAASTSATPASPRSGLWPAECAGWPGYSRLPGWDIELFEKSLRDVLVSRWSSVLDLSGTAVQCR